MQADIAQILFEDAQHHGESIPQDLVAFLMVWSESMEKGERRDALRALLAEQLILRGAISEAESMISTMDGLTGYGLNGWLAFLSDKNNDAIAYFETAFKLLKKSTRKRKIYFKNRFGLFYILSLVKSNTAEHLQDGKVYASIAAKDSGNPYQNTYISLKELIVALEGDLDALADLKFWNPPIFRFDPVAVFIEILIRYWTHKRFVARFDRLLKQLHDNAQKSGYAWLAAEIAVLLSRLLKNNKKYTTEATGFFEISNLNTIVDLVQSETKWKKALNALIRLKKEAAASVELEKSSRLVWLFSYQEKYGYWTLSPREQVKRAKGEWSKGRKIALKRLYGQIDTFDFLTLQDRAICGCIEENVRYYRGYPEVSYYFHENALALIVGHPLVFLEESPELQVELIKGHPELLVKTQSNGKFLISFTQTFNANNNVQVIRETINRYKVVEAGEEVRKVAQIIGKGLTVPVSGKNHLLEAINTVSSLVTVHSQIKGIGDDAQDILPDPTPNIYLRPFGAGLKLEVLVHPFETGGPFFRPGEGGQTVISEIGGKQLRIERDLAKEKQLAEHTIAHCPRLIALEEADDQLWEWDIKDPEDGLEVLMELRALGELIIVKWPEGQTIRIQQQADIHQLYLNVKKQNDWFAVSGELKLDEDLVFNMDQLLSMIKETPGRFIRLKDGQFLALTKAFRKRLDELDAYSTKSGNTRRFHPLAALSIDDIVENLGGLKSDKHWKAYVKRLHAARSFKPSLPSTFKAELRDYQIEGYNWLARLSHWGVGACLADDMGLGKTIQALAIILTNANQGPSLVVAPTSVCMNWEEETARFAPTIDIVTLNSGDRDKIINGLQPYSLLLVSYGLLQQEKVAEMIAQVNFKTIVLDEAQAIKNFTTKRSQAAMNLNGDFKLITTGTPIENHLGELWNLLRFINPGLLGTYKHFNETFAIPIEKDHDRDVRKRLKKLVQPFILRRTKDQVLEELPQRTDITLQVELSPEEIAFYEALRRKALEKLTENDTPAQNAHLRILAEIMKLRRACCHTKLVLPDSQLPSAKLNLLGVIVEDLLTNGHKALIFSQFTGHLAIIRKYIEDKRISYQYLDGSTSPKDRKRRVAAFQGGEGEVFLISLKAGGLGLNLTAADYVIHMDPWWNPAVEDQASDRAHRIGQKRPVTVYSLVAKHTIEEKIVALHNKKRDLADSLLEGADNSGKITTDELLRLIRDP